MKEIVNSVPNNVEKKLGYIDLGTQTFVFWPTRKFWRAVSVAPSEWEFKLFTKYPLILLNVAGGMPGLVYLGSVLFFGVNPTYFYNVVVILAAGFGICAKKIIRGLIEHEVRKELRANREALPLERHSREG